ncbi:TIM barrel protein [Janthinobacterium psychrotolerans]|uniref:2-keto-myo-inositol isomerase n=1 Tax=Janthinobacterium psychrotolerans TaxID=1747903 RepID=A0A1A7C7J6_9BURK|nr:TIM barrel protein [Janthinobacterium psychrotolerans]OBV41687.1 2-keto-myo-inositol isomerase [Janthinobacterium psychrotolerans]
MTAPYLFSLNRMSAPRIGFADYLALCQRLDVRAIEIRNDLDGVEINDGTPARQIREMTQAAGITIRSINALQRFEQFDAEREREARALIDYAADCGAQALVLCPTNSLRDSRDAGERHRALVAALTALKPMLAERGVLGLIEPLGFAECAVRRKSQAVLAMYDAGAEHDFKLVHDTFHHHLAGEDIFFPDLTGLIHVSGVEDGAVPVAAMRDMHRVLVGAGDRLGNLAQIKTLLARGYQGCISYEPFAEEVAASDDIESQLRASMAHLRDGIGA